MEIHLDQIHDEPFRWRESPVIPVDSLERAQLLELDGISWTGEVARTTSGFLLTARLRYSQTLECPRCLGRSPEAVDTSFELLIQPKSAEPMVGEVELEENDLNALFLDGETLETDAIVIEQIQLNVPMRKLCREDCAGLCPDCGMNLNIESCDCESRSGDPRWSALAGLRDQLES